ncbi:hypothetical protein DUNSADRAFT_5169 [Dunaliella salina]|uniref:Uncharacterized protein n=1 Tax=Dunaliella salina TaxID=3046 RepID=A0ABQ7H7H1_DUNSA|nr:hypothetical protein DUNSADRAFT_5169 [Dunaliella salina]|eukprot:KAF5842797.1 hypothetical protein DUNSADRAFT_5169 [Dunaliella salina]
MCRCHTIKGNKSCVNVIQFHEKTQARGEKVNTCHLVAADNGHKVDARHTLAVNLWGVADVTESLLPLMPTDGTARVVMMGSRAGQVRILGSPQLQDRFTNVSSRADLAQLMDEWVSSIEGGQSVEQGWPKSMYGASKLALNSYTRVQAKEVEQQRIAVNSCTPGYCSTDLTSGKGNKTAYDGVKIASWLATKPPDVFETGCFWALEEKVQKEHF